MNPTRLLSAQQPNTAEILFFILFPENFWTYAGRVFKIGPVAALATLKKMKIVKVHEHVQKIGETVTESWRSRAAGHGLEIVTGDGYPCLAHFKFVGAKSEELRTLFTQMMLEKGFLGAGAIYPTFAHTEEIVHQYDLAIDEVFGQIALAIKQDQITELLKGPVAHAGFKRLN